MSGKAGGTTPFLSLRGLRGKDKLSIPIAMARAMSVTGAILRKEAGSYRSFLIN